MHTPFRFESGLLSVLVAAVLAGCPASPPAPGPSGAGTPKTSRWIRVEANAPSSGDRSAASDTPLLERTAYDRLVATVPTLTRVVPEQHWTTEIELGDHSATARLSGTTPELFDLLREAADARMDQGRFLTDADVKLNKPSAVISLSLARKLFDGDDPIGKQVRAGGTTLEVVGVVSRTASPRAADIASELYLPLPTLDRIMPASDSAASPKLARLWLEVGEFPQVESTLEIVELSLERSQPSLDVLVEQAW